MSQDKGKFQSKPRSGGQKFGGKGKPRSRPSGNNFGKRFEGDRDSRPPRRDRPEGANDRPFNKERGDRPARSGGGKPWDKKPRSFGDRDSRPRRDDRSDRPARPYSKDRPERSDRPFNKDRSDRPYNKDRPARSDGGKPWDKKPRSFGDRDARPRRDDRPARPDHSGKPFEKRDFGGDKRSFDRKDGGFERKKYDDRNKKPYQRYDEKKPRRPKPERFEEQQDFNTAPASDETRQKLKSARAAYGAPSSAFLYGVHAVSAALLNKRRTHQRLLCTENGFKAIEDVYQEANANGITLPQVTFVEREDIDRLLPRDAVHQDILLDCQPQEEVFLADILISAPDDAKVLVLDQVTDPHNVGAILRSSAAFGATAVIVQKLHAPDITGTLAKAASGAAEYVPMVKEVNLSRALEQLKEAGFFCIGLDEDGKDTLAKSVSGTKIALVMGAEGSGLRRLVAENCDILAKLPTGGPISSLNVSNAAAISLYELARNSEK